MIQIENQFNDINNSIDVMRAKYQSVLAYFGEEATMPSQEFFSTLEKFVKVKNKILLLLHFLKQ